MEKVIYLKDSKPLAQGRMRYVYAHPGDPELVIKVIRPEVIDERWGQGQPWYKMARRYGHYISYMREIGEYVAGWARYGRALPFAQKTVGLVGTDMGLGLVLEAVRDDKGGLAPSLSTLLGHKIYTPEAAAALERFITQILESDIIVADLHPGNIVYSYDGAEGHHFVMIDGLGLSTLFPFKAISKRLNRKSKLKHIARLRGRMTAWLPGAAANLPQP